MRHALLALSALSLAACGGVGGGGPADPGGPGGGGTGVVYAAQVEIPLVEAYSVYSENPLVMSPTVWVGDSALPAGGERRGFFRFDVSGLPVGATIVSAQFRTLRTLTSGDVTILGNLWLDDVHWEMANLSGLNGMYDFSLGKVLLQHQFGDLFAADVKTRLQAAVTAGRSWFNLRAHWDLPYVDNGTMDAFRFDHPGATSQARLEVVYTT